MAATTTRYGLPFQEATDPPNGAGLGEDLAAAIEVSLGTVEDSHDTRLDALEADVTALETDTGQRGLVRYGNRATTKPFTAAETPILRLDGIPLKAGRAYSIRSPQCRVDFATGTDKAAWRLRASTAGSATTASTIIAHCETADQQTGALESIRMPAVDETLSVLLTAIQYAGSSTATAQVDGIGLSIVVEDIGLAKPDTGIDL